MIIKCFHDNFRVNTFKQTISSTRLWHKMTWPKTIKICNCLPNWVFAKCNKLNITKRAKKPKSWLCGSSCSDFSVSEKKRQRQWGENTYILDSELNIDCIGGKRNIALFTSTQEALKTGNVNMYWNTKSSVVHLLMG